MADTFIQLNEAQLAELHRTLSGIKNGADRALFNAVKAGMSYTRTQFKKEVRNRLNLKDDFIYSDSRAAAENPNSRPAIFSDGPSKTPPRGIIGVRKKAMPAGAFGTTVQTEGGALVRFQKNGSVTRFPHYFQTRVASARQRELGISHVGIFGRTKHLPSKGPNAGKGKIAKSGYVQRFAIAEIFGPSVFKYFGADAQGEVARKVLPKAHQKMYDRLESQLSRFLGDKGAATEARLAIEDLE